MTTPNLTKSGARLKIVDELIMRLVRLRMKIAGEVVAFKMSEADEEKRKIVRPRIEVDRIEGMRQLGSKIGLDPNFAASLEHQLIDHSCKVQLGILEGGDSAFQILPADTRERNAVLKKNLGQLCSAIARQYDRSGGDVYPGTDAYVVYENELILGQVKQMGEGERTLALDLGCAVGRVARLLSPYFEQVIGYDLSQSMISEAWNRKGDFSNLDFQRHDLEEGIPLPDDSVDLVVMGLGTASDMPNLKFVLGEIGRVLRPGGRFVLSFYHRDALMYQEGHITIDGGLGAEINVDEECLTVHIPEHEVDGEEGPELVPGRDYLVYARPYTWSEIETVLSGTPLTIDVYRSYPTIASVVPRSLLENDKFMSQVAKLDKSLEYANSGAYYAVAGKASF